MAKPEEVIRELEQRVVAGVEARDNQIRHMGKTVASLPKKQLEGTTYADGAAKVREAERDWKDKERTIQRWLELGEQLSQLRGALDEADASIRGLKDDLAPSYEHIGAATLSTFEGEPSTFAELQDLLTGVLDIDEEIRRKERELQQLESSTGPASFIEKTLKRGKGLVIRGGIRSKGAHLSKELREIGERVCDTFPPEGTGDNPVSRALYPVRAQLSALADLQDRRARIQENISALEDERAEVERREGARNPVRNLEHHIERLNVDIAAYRLELGETYLAEAATAPLEDPGLAEALETIERIDAALAEDRMLVDRHRAAAEVRRLDEEISNVERKIARLEGEIGGLRERTAALGAERAQQAEIRGSEDTL